ncbi:MAG TPA: flavodoxin domain-containing protein [Ilumatobacteraceae bacterium]|nr:flavodoxin domain-containing protein [Ilumatobacteraceae bacterium]
MMRALVVYESMFGNTHAVAAHIAEGIQTVAEATVVTVHDATQEQIADADLVIVGGPTHVHGMSSERSRAGAADMAAQDDDLELDPDAPGEGLRDWFRDLADGAGSDRLAAAFDTRVHASALITGQASNGIAKRLRAHGFTLVVDRESFFVDKSNHLEPGEDARAAEWGRNLALAAQTAQSAR